MRRQTLAVGLMGFGVLAGACSAMAQEADATAGQELFLSYCAQCHGAAARGTGPMAEILAIETPDLTGLSARNGGAFPAEAVARQIDGRAPMLAHGGDMPVFGPAFDGPAVMIRMPSGQPMLASVEIADLLAWLESVQQ